MDLSRTIKITKGTPIANDEGEYLVSPCNLYVAVESGYGDDGESHCAGILYPKIITKVKKTEGLAIYAIIFELLKGDPRPAYR